MKISGLEHVVLKVTDMENSRQLYHGVLEMPHSGEHERTNGLCLRRLTSQSCVVPDR